MPIFLRKFDHKKAKLILDLFYKNEPLEDPNILIVTQSKLLSHLQLLSHIQSHYNIIISLIKSDINNPDFEKILYTVNQSQYNHSIFLYTTKFVYKHLSVNILPLHPYAFSIPSKNNNWVLIAENNYIPSSLTMPWNQSIFSEIQIKLTKDSNFNLEIKDNIEYNINRIDGNLIYTFSKSNKINNLIVKILKSNPNLTDLKGSISILYIQNTYNYNKKNTITYIEYIENVISKVSDIQHFLQTDYKENERLITEYKNNFNNKMSRISF